MKEEKTERASVELVGRRRTRRADALTNALVDDRRDDEDQEEEDGVLDHRRALLVFEELGKLVRLDHLVHRVSLLVCDYGLELRMAARVLR